MARQKEGEAGGIPCRVNSSTKTRENIVSLRNSKQSSMVEGQEMLATGVAGEFGKINYCQIVVGLEFRPRIKGLFDKAWEDLCVRQ